MPICKNCGARIEKFNKDMCPICGFKNPLDGATSDTVEITSEINMKHKIAGYNPRKKKVFSLLTYILSVFGVNFFYLKRYKVGLAFLLSNLILISGLTLLLRFSGGMNLVVAIIAPFVAFWFIDIALSHYLFHHVFNHKDGNGNFTK